MSCATFAFDFGLATQWLSFLFFAFWFGWLMFFLGGARTSYIEERERRKRERDLLLMRHVAPGPPLQVQRVDPRLGLIFRHWDAESESELRA